MTVTVDQSKLVLNEFALHFENNLISADLLSWKQYDGEFNDRNGFQISEQVTPRYTVRKNSGAVADLTSGVQGSVFGSEQFRVSEVYTTDMGWADFVKIRDVGSARENEALKAAARNLAESIDADAMRACGLASNNWLGTPANGIATYNDFASGITRLMEEGVEMVDLRGALGPSDRQSLAGYLQGLAAPDALATTAFRQGFKGTIDGFPTMFTQQLAPITVGTRAATGASQVDGANQNVNYAAVAVSGAPGQFMTQTLLLKGVGNALTIAAGEVFTIAGVNAYDNRKGASLGRLQQFTVVTGGTSTAGGALTIRVFPAIIVPGSGSGVNININTAHATVTAAPADSAPITFIGTASTTYTPRFIMQKQAVVASTQQLAMPDSDTSRRVTLAKVPLSVRMWKYSDFNTGEHKVRFDTVVNFNVRDRRRIVRINGA